MRRREIAAILMAAALLCGCGTGNATGGVSAKDAIEARLAEEGYVTDTQPVDIPDGEYTPQEGVDIITYTPPQQDQPQMTEEERRKMESTEGVDIDLTKLSSTMVYSEVYNMMYTPQDYIGKVVKMQGTLGRYNDEVTKKVYYSCVISDATACCSEGVEFLLKDGRYPAEGDEVCVVGTFSTYDENGTTYCTVKDAFLAELTQPDTL